jgi:hypothetical protein
VWGGAPRDIRVVRGVLAQVSSYVFFDTGVQYGATQLDVSLDSPPPGTGIWYLVRNLSCGSWQTLLGAEPARDLNLP